MVEFAMVLPLLLVIILLIIGVASVYTVRTSAHKLAYDAARHVAKNSSTELLTDCGQDLRPSHSGDAQAVIDYYYNGDHANHFLQAMTSDVTIESITTGPPITVGPHSQPDGFYCNQAVQVTISYQLRVPAWEQVKGLLGSGEHTGARETGVATRLAQEYDTITCKEQPTGAPGC